MSSPSRSAACTRIAEELKAPKGDLIISEVYMGNLPANTLWEIYNPTEETIDLTPYTMQRFDLNGSSLSLYSNL